MDCGDIEVKARSVEGQRKKATEMKVEQPRDNILTSLLYSTLIR
jgi:hypothetical protein